MQEGNDYILVTGGLGYIGSHTVVELINRNHAVIIIDNLLNTHIGVLDNIEKITGKRPLYFNSDLRIAEDLQKIFSAHKIESVIHFAAFKSVNESLEMPLEYYENNITGLLNVLKVSKDFGVKNFIFSSSCAVYGEPDTLPIVETHKIKPATSPYGKTKQMGEEILSDCAQVYGMHIISLRYFNPIGAHHTSLIGELPKGVPQNLVPYVTQTVAGIREKLFIFGKEYNTPDGTCIRDFIHVCDLADAHISALDRIKSSEKKGRCEIFNIGTGTGHSVLEIVSRFEQVTGKKVNYEFAEGRKGDVVSAYADCSKALSILGWKAKRSLDDSLLSSWNWQKNLSAK